MAKIRNQTVKLGIFVVTVVVIMVLSLLLIGGLHRWKPVDRYFIVTSRGASGVDVDSTVTLRGVAIGKVVAIELGSDAGSVTIELAIDPGVALPAASIAYFQRVGVTGQRAIDITGGTLAGGQLAPGTTIPRGLTVLESLESRADGLGDDVTTLVADARETVHHAKAVVAAIDPERVAAIVDAIDPARVEAIVVHTERTMKTLDTTSKNLARAVSEGRAGIADLTEHADTVAQRATTVLEHADGASQDLSKLLVAAALLLRTNEDDVRATIGNLRRASQDGRVLIRALRQQPSLILRSAAPKERKLP